ncbi:hypothetical protein E0H26_25595 [Micromonospora zingiberis]|uniref:Uncharacterized protein n=1 Tax=Micromonospora zingiberis TaxID=2053011 RepID=A0A4R0G5L7_9ACTN|nr:hypothetical protein [Micromonospora zingiberis]TCB91656.1 hypothetical protein E0H26_25595 [Micromonospora zingiberis]
METALRADHGTSSAAARLNKILNGLNTQVRAVETPTVDIARAVWSAAEIGDRLNKIIAGLNKIFTCLNTRRQPPRDLEQHRDGR